jgi:hypothetical protein
MNPPASPLRRGLVAVAAFCIAALCVARAEVPDADSLVSFTSDTRITLGMHRSDVLLRLGRPDEAVSTGMWVYWDFRAKGRPPGELLDTLVVFFAKDRVTFLRLTERKATLAAVQQLRQQQAVAGAFSRQQRESVNHAQRDEDHRAVVSPVSRAKEKTSQ